MVVIDVFGDDGEITTTHLSGACMIANATGGTPGKAAIELIQQIDAAAFMNVRLIEWGDNCDLSER